MTDDNVYKINIRIKKSIFNDVFLPYLECTTRNQIFFGGSSAGKSQFVVGQRVVWDLCKGGRNYLIIRNVARTSRGSTFNEVRQTIKSWKLSHLFKVNKSDMTITCINGYQIYFEGLDDVEKLKSIRPEKGVITDIVVEEATETDQDDIKQLRKRLRGKSDKPKRLVLLFNPILQSHWIHEEFFRGCFHEGDKVYHDDGLLILHTTYKDNRFLEPDDIKELEDETVQYFYDVYTLGKWGVLGGVIFTNWKTKDLSGYINSFDNIKNGVDFGFAEEPFAYNRMHYDKMRQKLYIFEELHEHNYTNPMIAAALKPIVGDELVVCDCAEPKSIAELRSGKIKAIGARKGPDSIRHGVQFLQQLEIIIDRTCQETINEFQQYQWKKLRDGTTTNVPVDKNNHHIDGIRYAMEDEMAGSRVKPRVSVINKRDPYQREEVKKKPKLKPGQTAIPIYVGDEVVGYEIIGGKYRPRRGITSTLR